MWRGIRIAILLVLLVLVGGGAWLDQRRTTSWEHTVWVGAFALNADGSETAAAYIASLSDADLQPVTEFVAREARRYVVSIEEPVSIRLYPAPATAPPRAAPDAGPLARALWSLRLRYYPMSALDSIARARPRIALFLLYHDPARAAVLPHSVGLQRGLMGVVHLFATRTQAPQNNIVIAHELLHTFGATGKYDADSEAALEPDGFAEPLRNPRYPQHDAEIMAGRVPLGPTRQVMPVDLSQTLIGPATAREIGWGRR